MSTRGSVLYHEDEEKHITIHIYEELCSEFLQDIRLEIETEHATVNVPWPLGLSIEAVQKLAIEPLADRERY